MSVAGDLQFHDTLSIPAQLGMGLVRCDCNFNEFLQSPPPAAPNYTNNSK